MVFENPVCVKEMTNIRYASRVFLLLLLPTAVFIAVLKYSDL